MLDAGGGKLAYGPGQIVDAGTHHLASLEREPMLAGMVDFLGPHDDDLSALDLFGKPGRLETKQFVQSNVGKPGHTRGGKFLPRGQVRKEGIVDFGAERTGLLDNAETRRCPRLQ